jgi:molecular chaperone HtpG
LKSLPSPTRTAPKQARWVSSGDTQFEITQTEKGERGTDIVLHIAEDSAEFLDKSRIRGILEKYSRFMPVEIEFDGKVINNPNPLWTKSPAELKDEDYLNFYKELYPFSEDPLFWIHLNVDYPFNLTGILYFPKVKNDLTMHKDKIQLYSRQVFIHRRGERRSAGVPDAAARRTRLPRHSAERVAFVPPGRRQREEDQLAHYPQGGR